MPLSRKFKKPRDSRIKCLNRKESFNVNHQPATFGGYKHCGRRDMMILTCHVISQDYVIKGPYGFYC